MYSETRNMTPYGNGNGVANKTQNFEVTAQYQFDFGLRPAISYLQSKGKDLAKPMATKIWLNMLTLARPITSTKICPPTLITKSTCWMKTTASTNNGISTDDVVALGLVYQF
jgi:outer membrane protein N